MGIKRGFNQFRIIRGRIGSTIRTSLHAPLFWGIASVLLCLSLVFFTPSQHASAVDTVPAKMNFQGRLTTPTGAVLANGTYNMKLKLYTVASGGASVWSEDRLVANTQGVTVTNGLFSIQLGTVTTLSPSLFASGALYLEVELPTPATATTSSPSWTEGAMTPRNQLATSAYAFNSEMLDGQDGAYYLDAGNLTGTVSSGRLTGSYTGITGTGALAAGSIASGFGTIVTGNTISGTRLISTIATGTAPLTVTSTTLVTNLNADLLDGQTGSYYNDAANLTGTIASGRVAGSYTGITGTGALAAGSIASGFGTILTGNTITGTTLNGTTGINTGAGAGTQRIDVSGNLVNIGDITANGKILLNGSGVGTYDNFLDNPGFETGNEDDGWINNGAFTLNTTDVHTGTDAITTTSTGANYYYQHAVDIPTEPGDEWYGEVWMKSIGAAGEGAVRFAWLTGSKSAVTNVYPGLGATTADTWTKLSGTAVAPATTAYLRVYIRVGASSSGVVHQIDDVYVTKTPTLPSVNVGGTSVITTGRVLQNVTADASILTAGTLDTARLTGSYTGITGTGALAAGSIASGFGTIVTGNTISGTRLISTVATGTAPLTVASTTVVTNLNADLLDGQTGSYYNDAANLTGTVANARLTGSYTGITGTGALAAGSIAAGFGTIATGNTISGTQLISTVVTGTAPLTVASTTKVTNLNADTVDGIDSASFAQLTTGNTFTGTNTFRGLTVNTATATEDQILVTAAATGAARFNGTITNADLTATRTYTLADASGTFITTGNLTGITGTGALTSGSIAAGFGTIATGNTISGTQLISTVATGTAPLTVASTTLVTNLNADSLDGQDGSYYNNAANLTGTVANARLAGSYTGITGTGALAAGSIASGFGTIVTGNTISGTRLISTIATGTAPLTVTSTTMVANLNSDLLDGQDGSYYNDAANLTGTVASGRVAGSYTGITGTGTLAAGSIASGFGTIATGNTITGTTLNGTTGINTGAGAGTQRIDASGNLVNINNATVAGTITLQSASIEGISSWLVFRNLESYNSSVASSPGAFVIETSITSPTSVMTRTKIEGYFYDSSAPFSIDIGSYFNTTFANRGYVNVGSKKLAVRLARNSTTGKVVIILGDELANYAYPKLTVTSFMEGHSGYTTSHATGWTISQQTDLTGYDNGNGGAAGSTVTVPDVTSIDGASLTGTVANAQLSGSYTGITGTGALAAGSIASGFGTIVTGNTISGTRLISTVATGTAPLTVASTTLVANLNADLLDGQTGSYYNDAANLTGTVANARLTNAGALTVTAGNGLTGGGSVALGGSTSVAVGAGTCITVGATTVGVTASCITSTGALTAGSISSFGTIVTGNTISGTQLISTVATGTAPLTVASTTVVTNLNADLLDGQTGSYYNDAANLTGTVANARLTNSGALTVTAGNGLTGGGSVALGGSTSVAVGAGTCITVGATTVGVTASCITSTGALTAGSISSFGTIVTGNTISGTQLISTVATGTAPLTVASTTVVTNLNADLLDGQTGSYYNDAANLTGTVANARLTGSYTGITGTGALAAGSIAAGFGTIATGNTISGTQLISTVTTGTAPLTVASTTKVANLNVDQLDGLDSTDFGQLTATNLYTGSNTFRGLTVNTATATQDQILVSAAALGAARFNGTITNADLTAARTYTLADSSGTFITTGNLASITTTGALTGGSISSFGTIVTGNTISGTQLISTVTTGTAPLTVASTTVVTNLNADLLDGQTGSYYNDATNLTNTVANARLSGSYTGVTGTGALAAGSIASGFGTIVTGNTISGTRLISTIATGTAPLTVTSTTLVANLNADLLDGQDGSYYNDAANLTGTIASGRVAGSYTGITGTGALAAGSIAAGFGTIATGNTITGTTLNGTTGINTGAGAGTQRIDASGNLVNIGDITANGSTLINGYGVGSYENVVDNPGFETGNEDNGWINSATFGLESVDTRTGNYALTATSTGANVYYQQSVDIPVQPGDEWYGEVWVKSITSAGQAGLRFGWFQKNGSASGVTAATYPGFGATTANTWTKISGTAVAPSDAAFVRISIRMGLGTTGVVHKFDDIYAIRGMNLPSLSIQGNTVITTGGVLQNVTADAGILTGTVANAQLSGSYTGITGTGALAAGSIASGFGTIVTGNTISGTRLISTVATGTAPLTVASTTLVANLNADLLDGQDGSYYNNAANLTGTVANARLSGSYTGITGTGALAAGSIASGFGTIVTGNTISGTQLISTVVTGTAPLTVASTTKVTNLNSDLLDGQDGTYYNNAANLTGTVANANLINSGALTVTAGNGLTGGGSVALGGSTSVAVGAGTCITVGATTVGVTGSCITSTGVVTAGSISSFGTIVTGNTISGTRLISTVTTGTAPLTVASTTMVANLNSDLLDGQDGSYYNDATNLTGTVANARLSGSYTGVTGTGVLAAGSIAAGFGTIATSNTISGTTLSASTGFNSTGANGYQVSGTTVISSTRTLQNVVGYTQSSGNATFSQNAADLFKIASLQAPTTDMAQITNAGFPTTTAGVNGLQIDYYANLGVAANIASGTRFNITNTSATAGTITNGIQIVATGAVAGTTNGIKIDNFTSGAGGASALYLGSGWKDLLSYNGTQLISGTGILQSAALSGTYSNALTFSNASNSFTGDGSGLTSLTATNLTGTVANAQLSGSYTGITGTGALAAGSIAAGFGTITTGNTISGTRLISTIATGTAPLTVTSTTLVTNLNADSLDGQDGSYYNNAANLTGTVANARLAGSYTGITGTGALAAGSIAAGFGTIVTGNTISGTQLISTIATGTAPLTVTSTTLVANLNADSLDGQTGSYYNDAANLTGTVANARLSGSYTGITGTGALAAGSIAAGFGTISTSNTITGTTLNGTTGINTGAAAGTQRLNAAGALLNITGYTQASGAFSATNSTATFVSSANSTSAFQIQNASAARVFTVDTTDANLLATLNPGFENASVTDWVAKGGTTALTRITTPTQVYSGVAIVRITTSATADDGIQLPYTFTPSTQYTLSLYAKMSSSSMATFAMGRQDDGATDTDCLTAQTVISTGWTRFTCTFTTGASISSSNIYVKQTDAVSRATLQIDAVQLEAGAVATVYGAGNVLFNAAITSPVAIKNNVNSTTAFSVQNAAGTVNLFNIDSISSTTSVAGTFSAATLSASGAASLLGGATVRGLTVDTATATDDRILVTAAATGAARFNGTITNADLTAARTYTLANSSGTFITTGNLASITSTGAVAAGSIASGFGTIVTGNTISGTQLISTIATGTAPLTVTSTTLVANLNADSLDGQTGSYYNDAANLTGTISSARLSGSYTGITGTGALTAGSIGAGFTTIATSSTITGTTLNGTTGINTGAGAGTQRIDASGNLVNIGTLSSTGAATIAGTLTAKSDSATAFRVQNAAATSTYLNVDTTGAGNLSLLTSNLGTVGSWTTGNSTGLVAKNRPTTFTSNGYMYVLGGYNGTTLTSNSYYAKINGDGTVNDWVATTALPYNRAGAQAVVAGGYVYLIGGNNSAPTSLNYSARINPDGSLSAWDSITSLPAAREGAAAVYSGGYIYVIGGTTGSATNTVYYAQVTGPGAIGSWTTAGTYTGGAIDYGAAVAANGYLYVTGGKNVNSTAVVYSSKIGAAGAPSTWTALTSMPAARAMHASVINNGYLYVAGGVTTDTSASVNTVYSVRLNGTGGFSTGWTTETNSLPGNTAASGYAVINGNMYVIEGRTTSATSVSSTVYHAQLGSKLTIGGSIDLVSLQGGNIADGGDLNNGSMGGSITAGNIMAVGGLSVQGSSSFANDVAVQGTMSASSLLLRGASMGSQRGQLALQGTGVGSLNSAYMSFLDSDGNRTGYVGDGNVGNTDMYVLSETGAVRLSGTQVLAIGNGTASAPGYSFGGTTDAGMYLDGTGNLSLSESGTQKLQLAADTKLWVGTTQRTQRLCHGAGDAPASGSLTIIGDCTTGGSDFAEYYGSPGDVPLGTIVQYDAAKPIEYLPDPTEPGRMGNKAFVKTASNRDKALGVHSTNPYVDVLGKEYYAPSDNIIPIGLAGRVPVRVNTSNGPIEVGDPIALSTTPGVGAKAISAGQIVGYAMQSFDGSGEGMVVTLVSTGYWAPPVTDALQGGSLDIAGNGSINGALSVGGTLNVLGAANFGDLKVNGTAEFTGKIIARDAEFTGTLSINGKMVFRGEKPTITTGVALGTDTTQQAVAEIDGTDSAGTVTVTSAGKANATGILAHITFSSAFNTSYKAALSAVNEHATDLRVYLVKTPTGFDIVTKDMPVAGTQYQFDYIMIGASND